MQEMLEPNTATGFFCLESHVHAVLISTFYWFIVLSCVRDSTLPLAYLLIIFPIQAHILLIQG